MLIRHLRDFSSELESPAELTGGLSPATPSRTLDPLAGAAAAPVLAGLDFLGAAALGTGLASAGLEMDFCLETGEVVVALVVLVGAAAAKGSGS